MTELSSHPYDTISFKELIAEQLVAASLQYCIFDYDPDLKDTTVLHSQTICDPATFDAIISAERSGRITAPERRQLLLADIIAQAVHSQTRATVHFVIEVSTTIHSKDLEQAAARSQIYGKVIGLPVQPLVIGGCIDPDHQAYAAGSPVPTLFHPRLEPEDDEADFTG